MKELIIAPLFILPTISTAVGDEFVLSFPRASSTLGKVHSNEWKARVKDFNDSAIFVNNPARIESCDDIYYLPVTTSRYGNISWGGLCLNAALKERLFICNDKLVGHFKIFKDYKRDPQWIAEAIVKNCWGG